MKKNEINAARRNRNIRHVSDAANHPTTTATATTATTTTKKTFGNQPTAPLCLTVVVFVSFSLVASQNH